MTGDFLREHAEDDEADLKKMHLSSLLHYFLSDTDP
jgi:hypothetical protein